MEINSLDKSVTVGTDVVIISEQKVNGHAERTSLVVSNTSTGGQVISISTSGEAANGVGLVLSPGGFKAWEKKSPIPIIQERVTAVSNLAGGTVAVHEEVLQ